MATEVLSALELERYDRQLRIFGVEGQGKLKRSTVLVVGLCGLGSAASLYLTAAGVGRLVLVDPDSIELSNLNRQILSWPEDVGKLKILSVKEKLLRFNEHVEIEAHAVRLDESNAHEFIRKADVVLDGLDDIKTRLLVNRVCVELGKPFVHASVEGFYGELMVIVPGRGPCLSCLVREEFPVRPPPILGATPGVLALLQVAEAIKLLTGYGEPAIGRLILYDGARMSFAEIGIVRDKFCPVCSEVPSRG